MCFHAVRLDRAGAVPAAAHCRACRCHTAPKSAPAFSPSAAIAGWSCCSPIRAGPIGARRTRAPGRSPRARSNRTMCLPAPSANSTRRPASPPTASSSRSGRSGSEAARPCTPSRSRAISTSPDFASNEFEMEWPPRSGRRAELSRGRPCRLFQGGDGAAQDPAGAKAVHRRTGEAAARGCVILSRAAQDDDGLPSYKLKRAPLARRRSATTHAPLSREDGARLCAHLLPLEDDVAANEQQNAGGNEADDLRPRHHHAVP